LILFRETIAPHSENYTKLINILRTKLGDFNITADGIYFHLCALEANFYDKDHLLMLHEDTDFCTPEIIFLNTYHSRRMKTFPLLTLLPP
jgi:hypothetical protein